MESTCSRCHQTVEAEDCFCPFCGLPQLVYTADGPGASSQPDRWGEAVRDAGAINWKAALRLVLILAVPVGMVCCLYSPLGAVGLLLMAAAAAWVVALYMRSQRPAWVTIGAGARIGLVTGVVGAWTASACTGIWLYAMRFWFHQGKAFDDQLADQLTKASQQLAAMGFDAQTIAANRARMLTPEGRAGNILFDTAMMAVIILLFAISGGALGARFFGRPRRPAE